MRIEFLILSISTSIVGITSITVAMNKDKIRIPDDGASFLSVVGFFTALVSPIGLIGGIARVGE